MSELIISEPNEKQKMFLAARTKYIAFGGARGGGKSWAVRTKAKLLCLRYPGIKVVIIRRTYVELMNNHIAELRADLYGIASYNGTDKVLKFGNGSTIKFDYCARDDDLLHFQGAEYDVIFFDEATQLSEYQIKTIIACLRGTNAFPKRAYFTCNPGGVGHSYIKRLFVDRKFQAGENPDDYIFIQSLVMDNKALMKAQPEYVGQLEALPPKLRAAWLYGEWDIFEGQFFEEFREEPDIESAKEAGLPADREELRKMRRFTHVIDPFEIPMRWNIYMSMDWGYSKPFSVGWWAIDEDGRAYRILEWYGCQRDRNGESIENEGLKLPKNKVFEEIHRNEVEHPFLRGRSITRYADPAMWDASTGESVAETASKYGVLLNPADHNRNAGWMQMHYRLSFDENGLPMMYVFKNCKDFIRTIPLMRYSETRVEDLDTDAEDHAADEARYFCMSRPIAPRVAKAADPFLASPLHTIFDLNKDDLGRAPNIAPVVIREVKK